MSKPDAIQMQRSYYNRTANTYDEDHVVSGDQHFVALEYVRGLLPVVRAESVLDVGAGTGRAVRFLAQAGVRVVGVEPVEALRTQAEERGGEYVDGSAYELPFPDDSFDVLIATGLMHHLDRPEIALSEMMRVACRGIMISDANRFGQGTPMVRAAKAVIHRAHLWPAFDYLRTHGKGYVESEGDGISYSYSVYDSLPMLSDWADRTFMIPTSGQARGWLQGFATSPSALLVAVREPRDHWARK